MSDPLHPPAGGDSAALDTIRREAKQLLRQARAGDAPVLAALKALLPRLAALDDDAARESIRLADVQHAIARRLGHESWAALKAAYERLDPLHVHVARFLKAVNDDDTAAATALLEQHPAIARHDMRCACAAGDLATATALLAADPASATRTVPGDDTPPLAYAVLTDVKRARGVSEQDHVALVRLLLDAGASPNSSVAIPDVSDRIPVLYFPSIAGNVAVARLLLERGANPTDGESLYHAAQHDRREVLALLREHGADLSHGPAAYGNTPLHFLAAHRASNPQSAAALRGMQWLLEHGADPDVPLARTMDGMTPSQLGETALHRVAASGHGADVVGWLLARGATVDPTRADGATPYVLAVRTGNVAAADALAAAGADVARLTPVDRLLGACLRADPAEARALLDAHPGLLASLDDEAARTIHVALHDQRPDAVALMLSLGWPLGIEGEWGGTPLHWAAWHGQVALARQLLEHGAPVNVRDSRYGSSPIAWTAHGSRFAGHARDDDYAAIVHLLLDAGATRAEAFNRWNEAPERFARPAVLHALRERGFAP
jgi:ankyrin repeat protein